MLTVPPKTTRCYFLCFYLCFYLLTLVFITLFTAGSFRARAAEAAREGADSADEALSAVPAERRRALLIGIDDYPPVGESWNDLTCCAKDARDLAAALEEYAGYLPENIVLMTFEQGDDMNDPLAPTGENIKKRLSKMASELRPSDSLLFAFCGHGVAFGIESNDDPNLKSYLCPCDYDLSRRSSFIDREWVMLELERCQAERKIVLMDACRDIVELPEDARTMGNLAHTRSLSDPIEEGDFGFVQIASCREKQRTIESNGNGLFTRALIDGLLYGGDEQGEITLLRWFDYAQKQTMEQSRTLLKSYPELGTRDEKGRYQTIQEPTLHLPGNAELPRWKFADDLPIEGLKRAVWQEADTLYSDALNLRKRRKLPEARGKIEEALKKTENAVPGSSKRDRYLTEQERIERLIKEDVEERARQLADEAANLYKEGKYKEALEKITASLELRDTEMSRQFKERVEEALRGRELPKEYINSQGQRFVLIGAGEFMMGSAEGSGYTDGHPRHKVKISKPFYMGVYEVTVGEFREFVESMGYVTSVEKGEEGRLVRTGPGWSGLGEGIKWSDPGFKQESNHPVTVVSWEDAQAYIRWLNTRPEPDRPKGYKYALPSEAQWEYACRAGSTTSFFWGEEESAGEGYLNVVGEEWGQEAGSDAFINDGYKETAPVGSYKPNAWGLYDMLGNVWEMCSDWYAEDYYGISPVIDPTGPNSGKDRVIRGGSWSRDSWCCRSASRFFIDPSSSRDNVGFRLALVRSK